MQRNVRLVIRVGFRITGHLALCGLRVPLFSGAYKLWSDDATC